MVSDHVFDVTSPLPTDRPVAVYYRQSTEGQIGNISTSIQTIDMVSYLRERGWKESDIYLIDMDGGVSGTKKIDERPGMKELFDLITEGQICAVACQDEDRLFRDITQIQVNIFIEACRSANVLVITPSMVYDFGNPMMGTYHARQFRFKCEMAAEYINSVIIGKLARAKKRMQLEGRWVGSLVAVGFMVDNRRILPDRTQNPNWRKYVPFPPYAEVVLEYFRLFLSYNGNLQKTARHIHKRGPFYPDPLSTSPPDGFFVKYRMSINGNGYCPSLSGLKDLLTNVAYIGHWSVKRSIRIYDNHEAIVPVDMFMQVFNYLSEYTFDGYPNKAFRADRRNGRPTLDEERLVDRPLCAGLMVSLEEGEWHNVGTEWIKKNAAYRYVFRSVTQMKKVLWARVADHVDEAVVELLRTKLIVTFDPDAWGEMVSVAAKTHERERNRIEKQLKALEQAMEKQIVSLDSLTNPQMIHAVQDRYEEAENEHKRLTQTLRDTEDEGQRLKRLSDLEQDFTLVLEQWDAYTGEQKRGVLRLLVSSIEALPVEDYGLLLSVKWLDGSVESILIERKSAKGTAWTPNDTEMLLALFDEGAPQLEIAKAFPDRIWGNIYKKLTSLRDNTSNAFSPLPIRHKESYKMYLGRYKEDPTPHRATGGTKWIHQDEELLHELLDRNANRLEIAEAFPARTWRAIRAKVAELRGKSVKIRGKGTIRPDETITLYWLRTGETMQHNDGLAGYCADEISHSSSSRCRRARPAGAGNGPRNPPLRPARSTAPSAAAIFREWPRRRPAR